MAASKAKAGNCAAHSQAPQAHVSIFTSIYICQCKYQELSRYIKICAQTRTHTDIYITLYYILLYYKHYTISVCVNALIICQYVKYKYRWSSTKAASDRFGSVDLDHLRPARQSQIKNPIVLQPQISAATGDCPNTFLKYFEIEN